MCGLYHHPVYDVKGKASLIDYSEPGAYERLLLGLTL